MIQNIYPSEKWLLDKMGCFSASRITELMTEPVTNKAKAAGELSVGAKGYVMEKVSELMTGTMRTMENIPALEWGKKYEPEAISELKKFYEHIQHFGGNNQVFFKYTKFSGASPDGLAENICFEVKCPENPDNHVENLLISTQEELFKYRKKYYGQIQMQMAAVAKDFDFKFDEMEGQFVSYCPLMIMPSRRLHGVNVKPDLEFKKLMDICIERGETMLSEILTKLS